MEYVTASSLAAFQRCQREYFNRYELGYEAAVKSDALRFGSALHVGLEAYWKTPLGQFPIEHAMTALKDRAADIGTEDSARLAALLAGYQPPHRADRRLGDSVEVEFERPIPGVRGVRLAGKIDLILEDAGGLIVVDHKSTSQDISGFGPFWQALQIDLQMNLYCLALGTNRFAYDVIRKPSIKMCGTDEKSARERGVATEQAYYERCVAAINEAPEGTYYQWREFTLAPDQAQRTVESLRFMVKMIRAARRAGVWVQTGAACSGLRGNCDYLGVCLGVRSLVDHECYRKKGATHEELTAPF